MNFQISEKELIFYSVTPNYCSFEYHKCFKVNHIWQDDGDVVGDPIYVQEAILRVTKIYKIYFPLYNFVCFRVFHRTRILSSSINMVMN